MITAEEALILAKKFVREFVPEYVLGKLGSLTKSDVGLGNVDNTSDVNKPVSSAAQAALDDKLDTAKIIDVVTPSFSSLPKTFYSQYLKSTCKVVGNAVELSNPASRSDDWSITFANGSLTISGTFRGSAATTAKMSVWIPSRTVTLSSS